MMRLIAVGAVLVNTGYANIISPAQGETWALNVDHEIQWDTEGLVAPLQVQVGPGDSSNASSSITTLARKYICNINLSQNHKSNDSQHLYPTQENGYGSLQRIYHNIKTFKSL